MFVAGLKTATDEGSLPEIPQYSPYYLPLNVFTASKGSNLYILLHLFLSNRLSLNEIAMFGINKDKISHGELQDTIIV